MRLLTILAANLLGLESVVAGLLLHTARADIQVDSLEETQNLALTLHHLFLM